MLQLPRARLEDAGQYVCTATNSAGQDQKSILLSVYGEKHYASIVMPSSVSHFTCCISGLGLTMTILLLLWLTVLPTLKPLLDSESEVVTPQMGSSVTLRCEARGIPEPEVTWYRNGLQLAAGNGLKVDQQTLEIMGVQVNTLSSPSVCATLTVSSISTDS